MSASITTAFIKQFEAEVHVAYQRMGSKLRDLVRVKGNLQGSSTTFQKVGKGTAGQKSRHGHVPTMSVDHTSVECSVADYYAADYVDQLDELKTNIDERQIVAQAGAAALGRKTDDIIITVMDSGAGNTQTEAGTGRLCTAADRSKITNVFVAMGEGDVPDDGSRFFLTAPEGWVDLLTQAAFTDADYIGYDELPFKGGMVAKRWLGFMWLQHSGLPIAANIRKNFAWHKNAVGSAWGADVSTTINYVAERDSNLVTSKMSLGAVTIDAAGIFEIQSYET